MNDSLTKRDSISTSAKHCDGVSPTPWRVEKSPANSNFWVVRCDTGVSLATVWHDADAAYIVEAVNVMSLCIDEKLAPTNLLINDPAVAAERRKRPLEYIDDLEEELRVSVREDAKTLAACRRWGEMYREQYMRAQRAEAERLRDLVRRLAEYIYHSCYVCDGPGEIDITSSRDTTDGSRYSYHGNASELLREAREALGEEATE